jgi:hypothetical protein
LTLKIEKFGDGQYLIPLVKCNSPVEILDWIIKLRRKPWVARQDLCDLVDALDDLLDLEENYCGSGLDWTDGKVDYTMRILDRRFGRDDSDMLIQAEER